MCPLGSLVNQECVGAFAQDLRKINHRQRRQTFHRKKIKFQYCVEDYCMFALDCRDVLPASSAAMWGDRGGGRVVERRTFQLNLKDRGLTPPRPLRGLSNFVYFTFPVSFERDSKNRWSLLYGAYARGSKIPYTGK